MSGGGKSQTSKSKTVIPEWVKTQYLKATDMAASAADNPWQAYSTNPNDFVAGLTESQQAGKANINQYAQSAQPWYQGAGQATVAGLGPADLGELNVDQYMNPYLRNVAQTQSDLMNQQNQRAMSGQLGQAIASGAAWGDRSGVALANLNQQQNLANAKILNDLLYQGYSNAQGVAAQQQGADLEARQANLARLMAGGQQLGQLGSGAQAAALQGGQAQMAAGQQEQQTEQAKLSAMYNQYLQEKGYDFQTAQFFANIAMGIGSNAGSTNVLTQPAGFFSGLARGGRAGKASGGGLGSASMGGHVSEEHALEGFADGGAPMDYEAMVMQQLFGGMNPSAGAYGLAGGSPGGTGFVPPPNMQVTGLKPAEAPPMREQTTAKDVAKLTKEGYDAYNSEEGQTAMGYAKDLLGFMSQNPSQVATGGRIGYGLGGAPYSEDPIMGPVPGLAPSSSYVPPPEEQNTGKGLEVAKAPSTPPSDGLEKIADIAKIAAMFFLKDGGVAGPRRGYDTGGAPAERSWSEWLDQTFPTNGPAAGTPPDVSTMVNGPSGPTILDSEPNPRPLNQNPNSEIGTNTFGGTKINPVLSRNQRARMDALQAARPSAPVTPAAAPTDNTEAINQAQEEAQKSVDQTWAESEDPTLGRLQSGLKKGQAALQKGLGVYLPGMVNWAVGDPTRANTVGGSPPEPGLAPAETPAAVPAEPPSNGLTDAERQLMNSPTVPGLQPATAPAPATAAAAPPVPKARPNGLVPPDISPVEQMAGERQSGLQMFQANAYRHEGDAINHRDPNGGTRAGFNLAQYQAINPSIRSLADVQQNDILGAQAKWWREQGGNDIEAKYGSEFAAAYTDLSMLNPNMARSALAQANGDPAKFFDIMGGKLASLGENPKYAPNTNGWLKRVADTKNFALTGSPSSADTPTTLLASGSATALPAADNKIVPGLGGPQTSGVPQIRQASDEVIGGIGRGISGAGQWAKQNQNILLPILSGIGAMASSPSRYLGSAILQGVGAGAGSYMKRQTQLADIASTQANTGRIAINAAREAIKEVNGVPYVFTSNGRMQKFYDWMKNPIAPIAGGDLVNNYVRSMGDQMFNGGEGAPEGQPQQAAANGQPGMPVPPAPVATPTSVRWTQPSKNALASDEAIADTAMAAGARTESLARFGNAIAASSAASAELPNLSEMAKITSEALNNPGALQPGAAGSYRAWLIKGANTLANGAGLGPGYFGNADEQAAILSKLGTLAARNLTPEQQTAFQALQSYIETTPNLDQPPEAMGAIMASLIQSNQMAIDRGNYFSEYAKQAPNGILMNADNGFRGEMSDLYNQERANLEKVISNKAVMARLTSGSLTMEEAQAIIDHALGETASPVLARYFVKG